MIVVVHNLNKKENKNMWVITVFEKDTFRIFEYTTKSEALKALAKFVKNAKNAILSYTR